MEKTDLVNYYKRPCFIFNGAPASIEDDEILDLDSISLDSNEDTWLWSNSKGNSFKEVSKEEMNNCLDGVSVDGLTDSSRISLTNWDSFKEQTVGDSFFNSKNISNRKKLEFNEHTTPVNHLNDETEVPLIENELSNLRKLELFSDDRDTFKKPISKKDISEKNNILYSIENKLLAMGDNDANDNRSYQNHELKYIERDSPRKILDGVIGQEKNYVELNGSEKRKSLINEVIPLCHSTPMPMLTKRRVSRTENENRSWQKSQGHDEGCGDSPFINSSTFGRREIEVNGALDKESAESKLAEAVAELTIKDTASVKLCNGTFEIDDNTSTSSTDSRRSSTSGSTNHIPRIGLQTRTLLRPSSSNPRSDAGYKGNIRSPSRPSSARKAPFSETKMKQPTRRAPSLNRLPAPSVNIDEEFVSVVEIKSKDAASKISDKKSAANGPMSHIPRPSTRIPVFRSSNSCTRSTFKK